MDDAKVLHACRLLHAALCDDLEVRRLLVHVERDRVSITIHPKSPNDRECPSARRVAVALPLGQHRVSICARFQQLRQLGDVRSDPPGFIAREQIGSGAPSVFILEIDVGESLPVGVAHDEAGPVVIDRPWRWEAACAVHRGIKLMSRRHCSALAASRRSITREKSSGLRSIAASSANKCSNSIHTGKPD